MAWHPPSGYTCEQNVPVPEPGKFGTKDPKMLRKLATVVEFVFVMVVGFVLVTYAWWRCPEAC
jgi:hypothetical protein